MHVGAGGRIQVHFLDPIEFQVRRVEQVGNDAVHGVLDPRHHRGQAFFHGRGSRHFSRGPVDLGDEGIGRHAEGKAHDAGQPFVVLILQHAVLGRLVLHAAGYELGMAALGRVAFHEAIPILLELANLLGRPVFGHADQRLGHVAFGVVLQLVHLAAQRDVHRRDDLLHRAVAVDAVHAPVAHTVDQLVAGEVSRHHALEHLLIGRAFNGCAAILTDHALDGRAVHQVQGVQLAATGLARVDGGRVDHQHVFQQGTHPGVPIVVTVGLEQELVDLVAAGVGLFLGVTGLDVPLHPADLILAGLDDEAHQIIGLGQHAQLGEAHRLQGAGRQVLVVAGLVVQGAACHVIRCHGRHGVTRAKPVSAAGADKLVGHAQALHQALLLLWFDGGDGAAPGVCSCVHALLLLTRDGCGRPAPNRQRACRRLGYRPGT